MIDEKKLIEDIKKYHDSLKPKYVSKLVDAEILDIIDIINEQPKVGEWIPVEEALPKELQRVLVQKVSGTIEVLLYYGEKNTWGGDTYHNVHPRLIKAWQPLPNPYEVEDE